jgi:hypothetical protein
VSVEDFEEIRNMLALYCHVIDNKEWDRLGQVYALGGSYCIRGSEYQGVEAIAEYLAWDFGRADQPEMHTSSNHHIEFGADGKRAAGRGKWLSMFPDTRMAAGDYTDAYVKSEVGWRIERRDCRVRVPSRRV